MSRAPRLWVVGAFAIIYFIWGSSYLGVRYAIETLPPLCMAGLRFLVAGSLLLLWVLLRGGSFRVTAAMLRADFANAALLGLCANGGITLGERTVPSGMAAVLEALVPAWIVLIDWMRPDGFRPSARAISGLAIGFAGIVVLAGPGWAPGHDRVDLFGALCIVMASVSHAFGTVYFHQRGTADDPILQLVTRRLLAGGVLLTAASLLAGEWPSVHLATVSTRSLLALAYLVFVSLSGAIAYAFLLRVSAPGRVATYAYVNPVVAVTLGCVLAHEPIDPQTLFAFALIAAAVATTVTAKHERRQTT
jgi:drug/metabolite transporter (DMT)-like permease